MAQTYREDGIKKVKCVTCKVPVELHSSWANSCSNCGTEYNAFGQELAPRSQWGYETGESFGGDFDDY